MRFVFIIIILCSNIYAKKNEYYIDKDTAVTSNILWQITTSVGFISSSGQQNFYEDYRTLMNPSQEVVQSDLSYSLGVKFKLFEQFRLHFLASYFQSKMIDSYFEPFSENSQTGRNLYQEIVTDDVPLTVNVDFVPYSRSQFRTYFGLGAGINLSTIEWREDVGSDVALDPRSSGVRYQDSFESPMLRLTLGTELNFDKFGKKKLLGSLFFESNISYIFRSIDLMSGFSEYEEFLLIENFNYDKEYNINNLTLQVRVGLSFNFYKTTN